jgi:hypothetical protein
MKFSIAAALLVSTTSVVAFQPASFARTAAITRPSALRAVAIDPTTGDIPTLPSVNGTPEKTPEKKQEPLNLSGIALSVSAEYINALDSRWAYP